MSQTSSRHGSAIRAFPVTPTCRADAGPGWCCDPLTAVNPDTSQGTSQTYRSPPTQPLPKDHGAEPYEDRLHAQVGSDSRKRMLFGGMPFDVAMLPQA